MYCSKCGSQNPDHAVYCSVCGTPLQTFPSIPASIHPEYRNLGGWLLIITIGLSFGLFGNIVSFLSSLANIMPYYSGYPTAVAHDAFAYLLSYVPTVITCIVVLTAILKRNKSIASIYTNSTIISNILSLIGLYMLDLYPDYIIIISAFSACITIALWTTYFKKSVRVKVYFDL